MRIEVVHIITWLSTNVTTPWIGVRVTPFV